MSLNVATLDANVSNVAFLVVSSPVPATIEALRRRIVEQNGDSALVDSLLTSVHIAATSCMHIFRILPQVDPFSDLDLSGLTVVESSSFSPQDLVSPAFPPKALRTTVSHFLNAVRDSLIDSVARALCVRGRLKAGFLISYAAPTNEWSAPWAVTRPFLYCFLQVHLTQSRLIVHPILVPTSFVSLAPSLPAGTPISLLPYGTPAYFLTWYHGPTSALSKQFRESFIGLGAHIRDPDTYIIAWVIVENRQGEDKGVTIIYPTCLCVQSISSNHPPLPYIPTLPATLQSSPSGTSSPTPAMSFLSLSSPSSTNAFRTLTGSKSRDIDRIAKEVGGFVDAVAKERERERERLKKLSRTPSQAFPAPQQTPQPVPQPSPPQQPPSIPIQPPPHSAPIQQTADTFYPSPPQANAVIPPPPGNASPVVMQQVPMDVDPQPIQSSYGSFDSNWMNDFLSFEVNNVAETSGMMGMADFEADFTEDDFSFFDTKPAVVPGITTGLTPAAGVAEEMWDVGGIGSVHTHLATPDVHHALPSPAAEKTIPDFRMADVNVHTEVTPDEPMGEWDAIPFDESYRRVDGKYSAGKFRSGLMSPPYEADGWYERKTDPSLGVIKRLVMLKQKVVERSEKDDWEKEWAEARGDCEDDEDVQDSDEDMDDDDSDDDAEGERPSTPLPVYLPLGPALLPLQFKHEFMLPLSGPLRSGVNPGGNTGVAIGTGVSSVPTPVSPGRGGKGRMLEAAAESLGREIVENQIWSAVWSDVNCQGTTRGGDMWGKDVQAVSSLFAAVNGVKAPVTMDELFNLHSPDSRFEKLEPPRVLVGKGEAVIELVPPALNFWDKLGLGPRSGKKDIQAFFTFDVSQEDISHIARDWLSALHTAYEAKHFGKVTPGRSDFCDDGIVKMRYDSALRKSFDAFVTGIPEPPPRTNIVVFILTPIATMHVQSPVMRQLFSVVRKASKASDSHILFQFIPEQILRSEYNSHLDSLCLSLYDRILVPVVRSMSRKLFQVGEVKKHLEDPAFVLARTPQQSKVIYSPLKTESPSVSLDVMEKGTFLHVGYAISDCGKWLFASCVDQRGEGHDLGVWLTVKGGGGDPDTEVDEMTFLVSKVWDFTSRFAKRANIEWRIVIAKLGSMEEPELDAWTSHLENGAYEPTEMGPVHVSIVSVDPSTPWMFTSRPDFDSSPPHSKPVGRSVSMSSSKPNKSTSNPVFMDVSATTYALFQHSPLPVSVPPTPADMGLDSRHIPDPSPAHGGDSDSASMDLGHEEYPHTLPLVPHASSTLIRVPSSGSSTMLHVHLLHKIRSVGCAYPAADYQQLLRDITHSYFALSVLSAAKRSSIRRGTINPILPCHLAAVEAMKAVAVIDAVE
ncbi:hypothetical protein BDZ89DRAFT_1169049 [Hymenopellis radicata]|nr:hypothetical protein BDZ89DRAFT_1169049 [Hymenopellis radicata]